MEEHLEISLEAIDISQFRLRSEAIRPAFEFKKKHDPAFSNMTGASFAAKVGIGESTWKKLYAGTATDAMCSTAWAIAKPLGLDPAVLFGLAPSRDYEREKQEYNPTLMDNMRRQIAALEERVASKKEKIAELSADLAKRDSYEKDLRERFLQAEKVLSATAEKASECEKVKKHKHHLAVCLLVSCALTITFAGIMIYLLWELQNPNAGNWQF